MLHSVTSAQKISFLCQLSAYPDHPSTVFLKETHMAWVFITNTYVWKLKKPVKHPPFLDFSTLAKREYYCQEEIRLNQRLANSVYIEAIPLLLTDSGELSLQNTGEVVDWLVKMHRLPDEAALDVKLQKHAVTDKEADAIGKRLGIFFSDAIHIQVTYSEYIHQFVERMTFNYRILTNPEYNLPSETLKEIHTLQEAFLQNEQALMAERLPCLVEGHGDLRPEHIYLLPYPVIIDCIEFSPALRINDPAYEIAYLQMECARMDCQHIGERIFASYCRETKDNPMPKLIHFYASFEAIVRARLAVLHLKDFAGKEPMQWIKQAKEYLAISLNHARLSMKFP